MLTIKKKCFIGVQELKLEWGYYMYNGTAQKCLRKDHLSIKIVDWHYRIAKKKELYEIRETASFENKQQQLLLKWTADVTRRGNNNIIRDVNIPYYFFK